MENDLLFKKVSCTGFLKKAWDGRFITLDKDSLTANLCDSSLTGDAVIEHDIDRAEKTYYEYVNKKCKGIVVGFIDIVVKGYLDVIYQDAVDVGVGVIPEKFYVCKEPKDIERCAIVYYANNKKHLVPIRMIEKENYETEKH